MKVAQNIDLEPNLTGEIAVHAEALDALMPLAHDGVRKCHLTFNRC